MKICIDPGHGSRDSGAAYAENGLNKAVEKNLTLTIAKCLRDELLDPVPEGETAGCDIFLIRVNDEDPLPDISDYNQWKAMMLADSANMANQKEADVFISIHCNASSNHDVQGSRVIYDEDSDRGRELAEAVVERLEWDHSNQPGGNPPISDIRLLPSQLKALPGGSAHTGSRNLAVLNQTKMPAILLEVGFLTNKEGRERLTNQDWIDWYCRNVAAGVIEWLEPGEEGPTSTTEEGAVRRLLMVGQTILVRPDDIEKSGIIERISDEREIIEAEVIELGDEYIALNQEADPEGEGFIKEGDKVLYRQHSGLPVKWDGVSAVILREREILGVLK